MQALQVHPKSMRNNSRGSNKSKRFQSKDHNTLNSISTNTGRENSTYMTKKEYNDVSYIWLAPEAIIHAKEAFKALEVDS